MGSSRQDEAWSVERGSETLISPGESEQDDKSVLVGSVYGDKNPTLKSSSRLVFCRSSTCTSCLWFWFGVTIVLALELAALKFGWVDLPDNGDTLGAPACYACVGLSALEGTYESVLDMNEGGYEFKVLSQGGFHHIEQWRVLKAW